MFLADLGSWAGMGVVPVRAASLAGAGGRGAAGALPQQEQQEPRRPDRSGRCRNSGGGCRRRAGNGSHGVNYRDLGRDGSGVAGSVASVARCVIGSEPLKEWPPFGIHGTLVALVALIQFIDEPLVAAKFFG